jgi:manganese-dependent ADP-ribose/CDP-alcohol diphosphatase
VIADVQYVDLDDAMNYRKTRRRHYRASLAACERALRHWKENEKLSFIAQLGDLIDGQSLSLYADDRGCGTQQSFDSVATLFRQFQLDNSDSDNDSDCESKENSELSARLVVDVLNVVGNHEMMNWPDSCQLIEALYSGDFGSVRAARPYFDYVPRGGDGWRIVVLDPYQFSALNERTRDDALAYLREHNPNDCSQPIGDWARGLSGVERRFVPYNGAIEGEQLAWFKRRLADSQRANERVIVLCHVPVLPGPCSDTTLCWNCDELLELIAAHSCVQAWLSGHDHGGGYALGQDGVHHKTFESPLEVEPGQDAFATVDVYDDRIEVRGHGQIASQHWKLRDN